jgi:hypothetical protein
MGERLEAKNLLRREEGLWLDLLEGKVSTADLGSQCRTLEVQTKVRTAGNTRNQPM